MDRSLKYNPSSGGRISNQNHASRPESPGTEGNHAPMPRSCFASVSIISCVLAVLVFHSRGFALEYSGSASLELINASGENTWISKFNSGRSKLIWPIELKTLGINLGMKGGDLFEAELSIATAPWSSDCGSMKDYDYLDESMFRSKQPHEGVDLYSISDLDSKALIMGIKAGVYPLRTRFLAAGITAGYRQEEYDYRTYNTSQTGYGPWQDQTADITGPTSFYSVNYDIFSLGLALRSTLDAMVLTFEAAALPLVYVTDEDEHLKRNRVLESETTGSGYQTSFCGVLMLSRDWSAFARCSYIRIQTDGDHDQYWYGDDPVTSYDDTGSGLQNIDTEINQKSFRMGIGVSRQF